MNHVASALFHPAASAAWLKVTGFSWVVTYGIVEQINYGIRHGQSFQFLHCCKSPFEKSGQFGILQPSLCQVGSASNAIKVTTYSVSPLLQNKKGIHPHTQSIPKLVLKKDIIL